MPKSEARKKLLENLDDPGPTPALRRGKGIRLSTDEDSKESRKEEKKLSRKEEPEVVRKKFNYAVRVDFMKTCKRLALEEDKKLYQVIEDALEMYLRHRKLI
jgi:hypothetical protein